MKKTNALLLILAIGGASTVVGFMYAGQIFGVENGTHAVVDFNVNVPDGPFVVKKGETQIIPIEIMAPRNKDVNLHVYVSETDPSQPGPPEEQKFSTGISASVVKDTIKVNPEAGTGPNVGSDYAVRDTTAFSITASTDATVGQHIISVTLFEDGSNGKKFTSMYRTVNIEN